MSLSDDLLKHKIFLQRLTKRQMSYMLKYIQIALTEARTYEGTDLNKLKNLLVEIMNKGIKPSIQALKDLADYEIEFLNKLLAKYKKDSNAIEALSIAAIAALPLGLVTGRDGHSIEKSYDMFVDRKAEEFTQTIRDHSSNTKRALFFALGTLATGLILTQLRSLSNSVINKVAGEVHVRQYRSNGIYFVRWHTTLDPKVNTCPYCEQRDGQLFAITSQDVQTYPPHAGCRCELEPVFQELGA